MKLLYRCEASDISIVLVRPSSEEDALLCHQFYRLRDEIFAVKYRWEEPRGEERDVYDNAAEFFLAVHNEGVIAGCRAIHRERCSVYGSLPMEEFLPVNSLPSHAVEISRMINIGKKEAGLLVYQAIYEYLMVAGGRTELYAMIRKQFVVLLGKKMQHLRFMPLAATHKRRGKDIFVPVRIERRSPCAIAA
jgi:hypothetical protein